jgi:hypothetical protein
MVAFMLCFDAGERLINNKFIGIDYGKPKEWLLYFRLWTGRCLAGSPPSKAAIQSGQTAYAPKIEMGHRLVPLTNYCQHRYILIHAIYRAVAKMVDWSGLDGELALFLKAHPESDGGSPKRKANKDAKLEDRAKRVSNHRSRDVQGCRAAGTGLRQVRRPRSCPPPARLG